ncbi:hypothetical protein [Paenibacillus sp. BC26]|uniref:hypothetical protein n=1 Tax=Paenibacillus sp. BC26 TaxID=1881032 RepID=UPI0008ED4247|nr:hypothetical protein [Paenibacillus sp. BC26]SFS77647.1 hypothetical protein SAMN05428962_2797 [Paenibacillus sp. BC26]
MPTFLIYLIIICSSYFGIRNLSPFRIMQLNEFETTLTAIYSQIIKGDSNSIILIISTVLMLISVALSIYLLLNILSVFPGETINQDMVHIVLGVLLLLNIVACIYYLLFLFIILLVIIAVILGLIFNQSSRAIGSGGGGPVRVRSYYNRRGRHVRSYTRRRPRR